MTVFHKVPCAALILVAVTSAHAAAGAAMRVYDSTEIAFDRYTVLKRIWVKDLRSAFWVPARSDQASARAAVLEEAARAGADAVVNLYCISGSDSPFAWKGYSCYGNAIRLKQR